MTKHPMKTRYPAPAETVLRMLTDREFHARKLEKLGLPKYEILDHAFDGQQFRIRIERRVPVTMPGGKKAGETTVINEEHWNIAERKGLVKVETKGMPLQMSCESSMTEDGDGCIVTLDWSIEAKIPVVGGQLEKFVVSDIEHRAADETRVALELLEDYR